MNATQTLLIAATVIAAGVGPFIAVHIGGKTFEDDEPEHDDPDDDTVQLPRITGKNRC